MDRDRTKTKANLAGAPTPRLFLGLRCLGCGTENSTQVALNTLAVGCTSCDFAATTAELKARLAGWEQVVAWLQTAPGIAGPAGPEGDAPEGV